MNIILDTCIFIRNDIGQKPVPSFNYTYLESLLSDRANHLFVCGFSIPEIYMLRNYTTVDDLMIDLIKQPAQIVEYNASKLKVDFSKYDIVNKYAALMFYHLTEFLEFFVLEVTFPFKLDDNIESFLKVVHRCTEVFHNMIGETNLSNCTSFMKHKAVDYIVRCIKTIFKNYGDSYSDREIWAFIAYSKIGGVLTRDVDMRYLRYGRFLKQLFSRKLINGARKIELKFGVNDLLIASATDSNFIVVTSDRDMSRYLLKYGNLDNKMIISKLWNDNLLPADY